VLRRVSTTLRGARLDDAEADALFAVYSSLPTLRDDARLLSFVRRVVRRSGVHGERRRWRESTRCSRLTSSPEPTVNDSHSEELLAQDTLAKCLATLRSARQRCLLRLVAAGYDDREIARELGVTSHVLAQRKFRLRERLEHLLPGRSNAWLAPPPAP
jgi:DNA-directed RNA polymerase specialized sigma24 family protein